MVLKCIAVMMVLMLPGLAQQGLAQKTTPAKVFSSFLVSGDRAYVKMRDVYIGSYGVGTKWSADSKALLVETSNDRTNARERRRILVQTGDAGEPTSALVRYILETGQRETLYRYRPQEGEGIEERIFVGAGSDVLFSVFGVENGALVRRLYFAPTGGTVRTVGASLDIRTPPAIIASPTQPRALVAVTTIDKRLQVFLIGPDTTRSIDLPGEWQFGQFSYNTKQGGARIVVGSLDEKERATTKIFDIVYNTGKIEEPSEKAQYEFPASPPPPFRPELYRTARVTRVMPAGADSEPVALDDTSLTALQDLDLLDSGLTPRRLAMARGVTGYPEYSPDGLKVAYETTQGYIVGELVALSPEKSKDKVMPPSP